MRTLYIAFILVFGLDLSLAQASYTVGNEPKVVESIDLDPAAINDPFEPFNRVMYDFNHALDTAIFRPASEIYGFVLPSTARKGVRNVITNLRSPLTFVNDVLQLNGMRAGQTLVRTLINTTLGIGGIFDVATKMGLEYHSEDFGQTMAVAGVTSGPYLVIPVLGPSTSRDLVGQGVDVFINPLNWVWYNHDVDWVGYMIYGVEGLDRRTEARAFTDELDEALDPYARVRSLYLQSRAYYINNEQIEESDSPRPLDNK